MWSSCNQALQARCLIRASAVALMTMSLNETLPRSPSCLFRASRASAARSMSTSLVRKKWGMGPSDVTSRFAIVLRIWVRGTSSYGAAERSGSGKRETGKVGAGAVLGARSRSFLTTRPPGPEPVTSFRSTPASFAMRRASGTPLHGWHPRERWPATERQPPVRGQSWSPRFPFPVSRFPRGPARAGERRLPLRRPARRGPRSPPPRSPPVPSAPRPPPPAAARRPRARPGPSPPCRSRPRPASRPSSRRRRPACATWLRALPPWWGRALPYRRWWPRSVEVEHAARRGDHALGRGLREALELLVVGHGDVGLGDAQHRGVELVERLSLDHVDHLGADAALR